jgi:hypothetical protein
VIRLHRIAPLALAGALLLTGCGQNAGTPGAAAEVDGKVITMDRVEDLAGLWCISLEERLKSEGTRVPMEQLKGSVATYEVLGYAARTIAEERGVEPNSAYEEAVKSNRKDIAANESLSDDEGDRLLEMLNQAAYLQSAADGIGMDELEAQGQEPDPANPQAAGDLGGDIILAWLQEHDTRFSPELGYGFDENGQLDAVDMSLSVPAGEFALIPAKNADPDVPQANPNLDYLDELPANAVCG